MSESGLIRRYSPGTADVDTRVLLYRCIFKEHRPIFWQTRRIDFTIKVTQHLARSVLLMWGRKCGCLTLKARAKSLFARQQLHARVPTVSRAAAATETANSSCGWRRSHSQVVVKNFKKQNKCCFSTLTVWSHNDKQKDFIFKAGTELQVLSDHFKTIFTEN